MAKILTNSEIGGKLKKLRERAGFSQEKLAELIEVSRFQIQKYERGQDALSPEKFQQLSLALSVPVQEFFLAGEDSLPLTVEEKLLLDAYRAIPDQEIQSSILKIATIATRKPE